VNGASCAIKHLRRGERGDRRGNLLRRDLNALSDRRRRTRGFVQTLNTAETASGRPNEMTTPS
jgi:hypothetical protein